MVARHRFLCYSAAVHLMHSFLEFWVSRQQILTVIVTEEARTEGTEAGEYGLHIRLAREMQGVLEGASQLAYKMGDVPKATLAKLINLFIGWGLAIQKKKWLDRMGYK